MADYFGQEVPKLGFGFMRLPKLADGEMDIEQIKQMVDLFMGAGLTYFDTAYVYDNGKSEEALKTTLVDRYPRDSFTICTKLCAWMQCHDEESAKQQFYTSLERTGAGYFDYYLLHAIQQGNYTKYDDYHIWDFVREQKEKGLIKHYGFSFHASPKLLDQLLTDHPEVDFVQLQINYADWENPAVASRENFEVARAHGKSITIMEPIKGGTLADPPEKVKALMREARPDLSYASWAIRFAASLDGIITVLSGMSTLGQVEDNVSYMRDFQPLSEDERQVIERVRQILEAQDTIPCTACHYCTDGCPMQIPIPDIFRTKNELEQFGGEEAAKERYERRTEKGGKASDCIQCGQCESACPQQLPIISLLEECASVFE